MKRLPYYRIAPLAAKLGIGRTALQSAVKRGEVPHVVTGDGLSLVREADVIAWAETANRWGRPRGWKLS